MENLKQAIENHLDQLTGEGDFFDENGQSFEAGANWYHRNIGQYQQECLEQCAKVFDPNSPIGIQISLTLNKAKSL